MLSLSKTQTATFKALQKKLQASAKPILAKAMRAIESMPNKTEAQIDKARSEAFDLLDIIELHMGEVFTNKEIRQYNRWAQKIDRHWAKVFSAEEKTRKKVGSKRDPR